jgi:membrane protein YqaA with SNARE-associated domain
MARLASNKVWRVLALLFVVGISVAIFLIPKEQADQLTAYGYPGLFLISLLSYATVLLPAPAALIVFSMGAHFPAWGVALAAGSGAALGELSGYLAGFGGQPVIQNVGIYKRMVNWMQRNGRLTVFALAAIPNPFFDITGIAAGALRMPVLKFLLFCWLGQMVKMFLIASAGAGLVNWPWLTIH